VTHDQEEALSMADRLVVLRDGRVQQVGTPEELHTRPANRHVADFMGYRNLLPMTAAAVDGGGVTVEGSGMKLRGTAVGDIAPGDRVVVGIRPEDLRVGAAGGGVPATVEVVEYQGRELAVEARTGEGVQLNLRATERPAPGDKIEVTADPERVMVFPAGDEP
jgi:putative spermidine/putrescine transport system ATP-binding protein